MKKNKFGFSLAEIIVVIALFVIIGVYTIGSFGKNFDKEILNMNLNMLTNLINDLDYNISKDITDYEVHLDKDKNLFYYTTNSIYNDTKVRLNFNSFSGIITTNDSISSTLFFKIFFDNKLIKTDFFSSTGSYEYYFGNGGNYTILSNIGTKELNNVYIDYFSKLDDEKSILLTKIEDNIGNSYSGIIIKNKIGQQTKKIFSNTGVLIDDNIKLYFEIKGVESILNLK